MSGTSTNKGAPSEKLPPLCYIRHLTSGETVLIRGGVDGWEPANTACFPACLNTKFDRVPMPAEILKHGSIMGWNAPGCDPAFLATHGWRPTMTTLLIADGDEPDRPFRIATRDPVLHQPASPDRSTSLVAEERSIRTPIPAPVRDGDA